jgi:hypothetical protein
MGLRLEPSRFIMTKAGRTRIKPSTAHLGIKSSQAPHFFIHIGIDRLSTQQGSLADINRDILNKNVTLQMNMVADRDKSANNIITFSIRPLSWGQLVVQLSPDIPEGTETLLTPDSTMH